MYFLNFLNKFQNVENDNSYVNFEYRLACSGELYNLGVETSDYRKSTACRVLLLEPFHLFVCSEHFYDYPQELCLRFKSPMITERTEHITNSFYPDEEVAEDISSLLSLFCRRHITVVCKTREEHNKRQKDEPEFFYNWPISFINSKDKNFWSRKPSTVVYGPEGIEIKDYNPKPKGIDIKQLCEYFTLLSSMQDAKSFLLSTRLYSLALQLIEKHPEISYLLFISSIETICNNVFKDYKPDRQDMIEMKRNVKAEAIKYGLNDEQSGELAVKACEGIPWITRKFVKFLNDFKSDDLWNDDDLFQIPDFLIPQKENFEETLKSIYNARGKMQHAGQFFPPTSSVGSQPTIPSRIYTSSMKSIFSSKQQFPPVCWFERVVNLALNNFLHSQEGKKNEAGF